MTSHPVGGLLLALGAVAVGGVIVIAGYLATRAVERAAARWARARAGSDTAPRRELTRSRIEDVRSART